MRVFRMVSTLYGFKPNIRGIRQVFKSDGCKAALEDVCIPIADRADAIRVRDRAEYDVYVDTGNYTAIGKVVCGNIDARFDNAENNTILKAR